MYYLVLYSLSILLATSKCLPSPETDVIDEEDDINMTNDCTIGTHYQGYCDQIGVCKPGTHIMCIYYRRGLKSGPACQNGRMIKLGSAIKKYILDKINTVRTGMSNEKIRGKNDVLLPKAKNGLANLKWDNELALLAQVWANQCELLAEDTCRATKKFSDPVQMVAVVKTVFERQKENTTRSCLKRSALKNAIDDFFITWGQDVKHVTSEDIQKYKGRDKIDGEYRRNDFLTLVNGKTTHIGCGLSAYESYDFTDEGYDNLIIELVCNLSSQLMLGEPVYDYDLDKEEELEAIIERITNPTDEPAKDITDQATEETITKTTIDTATDITDKKNEETTEQLTSPPTTSPNNPLDHTTSHAPKHDGNSSSEGAYQEGYGNGSDRRPTVLILPIITVEDAPGDKYLQKLSLINENLRAYSKKVLSSKNLPHNMNKQAIQKPCTSRKGSIFTRVPTFHLPSQNHDSRPKDNLQDNVLLRNKLKALLKKVPRKDLSRLEEALEILKRNRGRRVNQVITMSPLWNLNVYNEVNLTNTEVPKIQSVDIRLKYNAPLRRIDGTDDGLLRVPKGVLKITDYGDKIKYPENEYWSRRNKVPDNSIRNAEKDDKSTVNILFGNIKDRNRAVEIQSQFDSIPTMRKQISIVHAKENNVFDEKYSKFQKQGYFNLYRNDKAINNYIKDTNVQEQTGKFVDGSKTILDDSKSKRRTYLENEIYKLKRKLQHLRQYIRRNDISDKDHFRPVVEPQIRRKNMKLKNVDNFYMPDRAHSLHEF